LFFFAVVSAVLVSCNKDVLSVDADDSPAIMSISAAFDSSVKSETYSGESISESDDLSDDGTKTYWNGAIVGSKQALWSEGDRLRVYNTNDQWADYVISEGVGERDGVFVPVGAPLTGTYLGSYYPADKLEYIGERQSGNRMIFGFDVNIPTTNEYQSYLDRSTGSIANQTYPMTSVSATKSADGRSLDNINLRNLFASLQLRVKADSAVNTIYQVDIIATSPISGQALVTFPNVPTNDIPLCTFTNNSTRYTGLYCPDGIPLDPNVHTNIFLTLAPSTVIALYITTNDGVYYRVMNRYFKRNVNVVFALGTLAQESFVKLEYPGTTESPVFMDGVCWAPVNCGYSNTNRNGLYYQWGRKYGQPWDCANHRTMTAAEGSDPAYSNYLANAGTSDPYKWYPGSYTDTSLWTDNSKGSADPCPEGWRLPSKTTFEKLNLQELNEVTIAGMNGFIYRGSRTSGTYYPSIFLPLAGHGWTDFDQSYIFEGLNSSTAYWTTTPAAVYSPYTYALDLHSDADNIYTFNRLTCDYVYQSDAYPVRCIHDL